MAAQVHCSALALRSMSPAGSALSPSPHPHSHQGQGSLSCRHPLGVSRRTGTGVTGVLVSAGTVYCPQHQKVPPAVRPDSFNAI